MVVEGQPAHCRKLGRDSLLSLHLDFGNSVMTKLAQSKQIKPERQLPRATRIFA